MDNRGYLGDALGFVILFSLFLAMLAGPEVIGAWYGRLAGSAVASYTAATHSPTVTESKE